MPPQGDAHFGVPSGRPRRGGNDMVEARHLLGSLGGWHGAQAGGQTFSLRGPGLRAGGGAWSLVKEMLGAPFGGLVI